MSEYGIKIKNISAAMLYEVNLGIRDYYSYKDAMFNNSLFFYYMRDHGMDVYNGESTRDIVCIDFDFGSKSYESEVKRLNKMLIKAKTQEEYDKIQYILDRVNRNKDIYNEKSRKEIREYFYENGVDILYKNKNKNEKVEQVTKIHYVMLFRTSAKAKLGQVIFINEKLYDIAHQYLTMGIGDKMPLEDAKIVELSAYAPLTTSNIIGTIQISVKDILILKDQDSFFNTMTDVVSAMSYIDENGKENKKCIVTQENFNVKNTLWDGMGLIESSICPEWINGMALLRQHLFKMCGFKSNIQTFFKDWCQKNNHDYETYQVYDMFGNKHYLKDIKIITTDNSIKWKKFFNLMGDTLSDAYEYWCEKIEENNNLWGVVKTDHISKLGKYQQLSYQMVNTLPCTKEQIKEIAKDSIDYVELLKNDNLVFYQYLRKYANEVNHYDMLADLYDRNHDFANSAFFRKEKSAIIKQYVYKLRKGKIFVNGDNLTVCGNPYALLLYSVEDNWENDPCFIHEADTIQCYTKRFDDNEYLAAFRNPHNSPNNVCYLHNTYSDYMERYFEFSKNIIAVNCIETDIQSRANGMDFDSDFMLVTNNKTIVECAKYCYKNFNTIVNNLKESGITYKNTSCDYAYMDNKFSHSRIGIGYSSNLAQLAMTYYWTQFEKTYQDQKILKELYDNFIILSVLAQVIIDGCKREYEIDANKEIERISKMGCMNIKRIVGADAKGKLKYMKYDFPKFMKYTREIKYTKDGKELPLEEIKEKKERLKGRINISLLCPMNYLEECLDEIKNASTSNTIPDKDFFIKIKGEANRRQITKIMSIIDEYDGFVKNRKFQNMDEEDYNILLVEKTRNVIDTLSKIKINNPVTMNRLIELALGFSSEIGASKQRTYNPSKYTRKILNLLYKTNKEKFLMNFKSNIWDEKTR